MLLDVAPRPLVIFALLLAVVMVLRRLAGVRTQLIRSLCELWSSMLQPDNALRTAFLAALTKPLDDASSFIAHGADKVLSCAIQYNTSVVGRNGSTPCAPP